jgi:sigma-E factor negative regulatory protein RseB
MCKTAMRRAWSSGTERLTWLALVWAAASASADEPSKWLQRMNHALTASSYEGTFAHWQGGKVEMLHIIHRVENGAVSERLVSLDGSGREFIRTGDKLACYLPDQRTVLIERVPRGESLFSFPQITDPRSSYYDIKELLRTRFNRRDTHLITVMPKDDLRYGYRLWIDDVSAMPLKAQLCDSHGHPIEQVVFTSFTPSAHIPDAAFRPEVPTEGFQWVSNDTLRKEEPVAGMPLVASALKLPPGFRMTAHTAQVLPGLADPVDHIVISDGLASVSVFVETYSSGVSGVMSARVGSASAFSVMVNGRKITAVGEVPPATLKSIVADSLRAEAVAASSVSSAAH